jgi:hypothetical protein
MSSTRNTCQSWTNRAFAKMLSENRKSSRLRGSLKAAMEGPFKTDYRESLRH